MIANAHSLASCLFDEPSYDSVIAFIALALYYGNGAKGAHYATVAYSLAKQVSKACVIFAGTNYSLRFMILPITSRNFVMRHACCPPYWIPLLLYVNCCCWV